jgi:DNA-binding response OmpR family regulator
VCSHERLARVLWPDGEADSAALHTLVYELRAQVVRPFEHAAIQSVRGVGYRLSEVP